MYVNLAAMFMIRKMGIRTEVSLPEQLLKICRTTGSARSVVWEKKYSQKKINTDTPCKLVKKNMDITKGDQLYIENTSAYIQSSFYYV